MHEKKSIPQSGLDLIKEFEGYHNKLSDGRAQAYPDPIYGWDIPTIGYGTTKYPDSSKVNFPGGKSRALPQGSVGMKARARIRIPS